MPLKPKHRLSQKQLRFAREYAVHGNGTEAARAAGYAKKNGHTKGNGHVLHQQGYENLRKPAVVAEVRKEILRYEAKIDPGRVQRRLVEISHEAQGAGQFGPAVRAEELLGKSVGMWVDQTLQLTGALNDSHISALLELARQRRAEPIDLLDTHKHTHNDDTNEDR